MKNTALFLLLLFPSSLLAQDATLKKNHSPTTQTLTTISDRNELTIASNQLTLAAALQMHSKAVAKASILHKEITFAVVDASGQIILLFKGDGVGPHNTEAARRKAFTALSTKTGTLTLGRNAKANPDAQNLAHLPELLLLGGGIPLWFQGQVIGAVGVAGGAGPEQDDLIAKAATLSEAELMSNNLTKTKS